MSQDSDHPENLRSLNHIAVNLFRFSLGKASGPYFVWVCHSISPLKDLTFVLNPHEGVSDGETGHAISTPRIGVILRLHIAMSKVIDMLFRTALQTSYVQTPQRLEINS